MSKTIMVVDDSSSFRTVLKLALQKAGYAVVEAIDGEDAKGKLEANKPHLIVCDVNMPRLDGLSFARHVKAGPHKFTPIIMLTTEAGPEMKERGKAAGVRAWIVKPFQPTALLDAVSKLVLP